MKLEPKLQIMNPSSIVPLLIVSVMEYVSLKRDTLTMEVKISRELMKMAYSKENGTMVNSWLNIFERS